MIDFGFLNKAREVGTSVPASHSSGDKHMSSYYDDKKLVFKDGTVGYILHTKHRVQEGMDLHMIWFPGEDKNRFFLEKEIKQFRYKRVKG